MCFKRRQATTDTNTNIDAHKLSFYRFTNDTLDTQATSMPLIESMREALSESSNSLTSVDGFEGAQFVLFETLNRIDQIIHKVHYAKQNRYIYGISGTDLIASKSLLCLNMRDTLGTNIEQRVFPKTYVLSVPEDRQQLAYAQSNGVVFIMKKNVQRQEGYHITTSLQDIQHQYEQDNDYVVVQEMLQDPYIIRGRKINLRVYLLVVIKESECSFYIYKNGFLYYTPESFEPHSTDPAKVITTGYIDRKVYEENPLSLDDLRIHMGPSKYDAMFDNIATTMQYVRKTYTPIFNIHNRSLPGTKFLIFGCDIAPDARGQVKLMEINKGPDLSYKDERDKEVKLNMLKDTFSIVGLLPPRDHRFVRV